MKKRVMDAPTKPTLGSNVLVRAMIFCLLIICFTAAYVVTIHGASCDIRNFCFFAVPESFTIFTTPPATSVVSSARSERETLWASKDWRKAVQVYSSVFQDLISEGFLSPQSKALCVETTLGQDVFALKEIGVSDAMGVADKASKPLEKLDDDAFDFIFSSGIDKSKNLSKIAGEIGRTLKPEGYLVVHTKSTDTYSLHSFIALFNCCSLIKSREIQGFDAPIREIVMKEEHGGGIFPVNSNNECLVPGYKREIVWNAEPLIEKEPLKPWIALPENIQNIKYLASMVDISFKNRYIYVDVGARSYGSSIGSWFEKQYPKQNKTFEIYAIEADKSFHEEYRTKKKWVKLLPYAAWVRNETLYFEVNPEEKGKKGQGMGRIKPVQLDEEGVSSGLDKIVGFDFAEWLKSSMKEQDFVVMKMDIEGTEFDLIQRLFETGAICLIDEIFLECHYNRWQKCCPGQRSPKYEKTYGQCMDLFTSLRKSGVLVHQWW